MDPSQPPQGQPVAPGAGAVSHGQQQHQQQPQQGQQQQAGQQPGRQQPAYDISTNGHYGASAQLAAQGYAPVPELYTGAWANVNQGLHGNYRDILTTYWQQTITSLETETHDYKLHQLPLARIKKVMKADPEVKMISAEAPILFAKGCDIFITELTMRAWIHAEENKRRTLQRSDIASALAKSDMFDFLIDIVPREEAASHTKRAPGQGGGAAGTVSGQAVAGAPAGAVSSASASATAAAAGTAQAPSQAQQPHPHQQAQQHPMAPPEYAAALSHAGLPQEQDYRQPPTGMYATGPVAAGPGSGYGQPQGGIYPDMEGMYPYAPMAPQQMYQMPPQQQQQQQQPRAQDPSAGGGDPTAQGYARHDGGEGDADAEGERDYEVG